MKPFQIRTAVREDDPGRARKALSRLVALAQHDVDRAGRAEAGRILLLNDRLRRARDRLASHDERYPAAALAALIADGPQWNPDFYARRQAELQRKIDAQPRPDAVAHPRRQGDPR